MHRKRNNRNCEKGSKDPYKIGTEVDKSLAEDGHLVAPIKKDAKVGSITLESTDKYGFLDGNKSMKVTAKTTEEVEKANWFVLTMRSIGDFFSNLWSKVFNKKLAHASFFIFHSQCKTSFGCHIWFFSSYV